MTMCYCVPLLLQSNLAEKLNHKIIANTGCFAFLKTDQLMMYKAAASAQDAFMAYSVCLYSLYHDYGKQFLKILLCDEFCPSDTLRRKSLPLKKHVTVIQYIIRPNFTHAFFDTAKRDDLIHSLAEYYLRGCSTQTPTGQWPDFLNCLDDDQWIYIANRLIQDADNLYRFLDDWADEWSNQPSISNLRSAFARSDLFIRSIDYTLCEPLIPDSERWQCKNLLSVNDIQSKIHEWRQTLRTEFISGHINGPDGLYNRLVELINSTLHPKGQSSIDIAKQYNIEIPLS